MNFFENLFPKFGKFILSNYGQILLFSLLFLFPICSFIHLVSEINNHEILLNNYKLINKRAKTALYNKKRQDQFISDHLKTDPSFLIEHFESMQFLEEERQNLFKLYNHPAIAKKDIIKKRISEIDKKQNHLSFFESDITTSKNCIETIEKLKNPTEISANDLTFLLKDLEEEAPEKKGPQFMIRKFHLESDDKKQFRIVELELLKREFLNP